MNIDPTEEVITGHWIAQPNGVMKDVNCDRIEKLISSQLVFLKADGSGWETLYLNPTNGTFWEHTYPQSEMHGGGPPELRRLSFDKAKQKYGELPLSEKNK